MNRYWTNISVLGRIKFSFTALGLKQYLLKQLNLQNKNYKILLQDFSILVKKTSCHDGLLYSHLGTDWPSSKPTKNTKRHQNKHSSQTTLFKWKITEMVAFRSHPSEVPKCNPICDNSVNIVNDVSREDIAKLAPGFPCNQEWQETHIFQCNLSHCFNLNKLGNRWQGPPPDKAHTSHVPSTPSEKRSSYVTTEFLFTCKWITLCETNSSQNT